MPTFQVTFSRNSAVALTIVIIPLSVAALLIILTLTMSGIQDWLGLVFMVVMLGVMLGSILVLYKRYAVIKAEVDMNESGITVRLLKRSPFYPRKGYSGSWDDIENVSTNIDPQSSKRFYLVSFRKPKTSIVLTPADKADTDTETPFGMALLQYVSHFNAEHQLQPRTLIHQRGYYDVWWAKMLTILCYLFIVGAILTRWYLPRYMPIWRLIQVLAMSLVWIGTYHANKRRPKA